MAYNKFENRKTELIDNITAQFHKAEDAALPYRSVRRIYIHSQEEIDMAIKANKQIFSESTLTKVEGVEYHKERFFILGLFEDFLEKAI